MSKKFDFREYLAEGYLFKEESAGGSISGEIEQKCIDILKQQYQGLYGDDDYADVDDEDDFQEVEGEIKTPAGNLYVSFTDRSDSGVFYAPQGSDDYSISIHDDNEMDQDVLENIKNCLDSGDYELVGGASELEEDGGKFSFAKGGEDKMSLIKIIRVEAIEAVTGTKLSSEYADDGQDYEDDASWDDLEGVLDFYDGVTKLHVKMTDLDDGEVTLETENGRKELESLDDATIKRIYDGIVNEKYSVEYWS